MAIRRKEQTSSSAIKNLVKQLGLEKKLLLIEIEEIWKKTMGENITKHLIKIELKDNTLLFFLDSAVLRHELNLNQSKLLAEINKQLEGHEFKKIKFL